MPTDAGWFDQATYDAQELRQIISGGSFTHIEHAVTAHPGVLAGFIPEVQGTSLRVWDGLGVLSPELTSSRGSYAVAWPGGVVTFAAADATYARIDAVVARLYDNLLDASGKTGITIEVIKGVPAPAPQRPPIPAGSLLLYDVTVAKGTGALSVADRRQWTAGVGGVLAGTSTERMALPTVHLRPGQQWIDTDTNIRRMWTGTRWVADQAVTWRGMIGQGAAGGDQIGVAVQPFQNWAPDFNTVGEPWKSRTVTMDVRRYSRLLQPTDGPGSYDLTFQACYGRAPVPPAGKPVGDAWALIVLDNSDPQSNDMGNTTGTIIAEHHVPLSTDMRPTGERGDPGTMVTVSADNVRFTDTTKVLFVTWHSAAGPVDLRFNTNWSWATMTRRGN